MINNNKKIFGIVGAIIIIIIIVGVIILIPKGKKYEKTVFIGTNNRLTIDGKEMHAFFEEVKVKKQNVKVYYDDKIIDGYVVTEKDDAMGYKNALTVYSSSGEYLDIDKLVFSYTSDLLPDIIGVYFEDMNSLSEVMRLVINSNMDIDIKTIKVDYCLGSAFDLDKDDIPEYVYSMGLYSENDKYTGVVMMEKGEKFYIIDTIKMDKTPNEEEEPLSLALTAIVDFNNDGNYEFVIQNDSTENGYSFFNFDGTTFNKLNIY